MTRCSVIYYDSVAHNPVMLQMNFGRVPVKGEKVILEHGTYYVKDVEHIPSIVGLATNESTNCFARITLTRHAY